MNDNNQSKIILVCGDSDSRAKFLARLRQQYSDHEIFISDTKIIIESPKPVSDLLKINDMI